MHLKIFTQIETLALNNCHLHNNLVLFCSYKLKTEPEIVQRKPNDTLLDDLKSEKVSDVTELPPNRETDMSRIPTPLFQLNGTETAMDLDYVSLQLSRID